MAAYFLQGHTRIAIGRGDEGAALTALKQADREHGFTAFARSPVQSARALEDALVSIGWKLRRDAEGTIDALIAQEPRKCYEDAEIRLFDALAPFIRAGSVLVLERYGLDEPPYMHTFDGKARTSKKIDKRDPRVHDEPVYRERRGDEPAPSWNEVKRAMPPVGLRIYSMSDSYKQGQWIKHVKLGPGLVLGLVEGNKMRVLFESGERRLAQGVP